MIIKEIDKQSYMNNNYYTDQNMQKSHQYIEALEEERRKIQVFHRELPLCVELVTQAINACKQQQLSGTTTTESCFGQSECSEQTSSEGPVLKEFIPMKRTSFSDEEEEEQSRKPNNTDSICISQNRDDKNINSDNSLKKSDWLRSVQLWNQTSDPPIKEDSPRKVLVTEVHRNGGGPGGGGFHPFKRERTCGIAPELMGSSPSSAMSSAERGGSGGGGGGETKREESGGHSQRKARRRCWSPELHRRFLNALQQLGGSQVATPKQIREWMKVDGLTNDEVKSHLQKYRLHERRPNPSIHNNNSQAPQFVVVGGIWVPPPEYAAATAAVSTTTASGEVSGAAATSNRIYAPIAATPPLPVSQAPASLPQTQQCKQFKQWHSDEMGSHSDSRVKQSMQLQSHDRGSHSKGRSAHSNSSGTSSSTHTTTASPMF